MSEDHYIGIDVGTGSARACIIDSSGKIIAIASKPTKLFRSGPDIYEQSTEDIWSAICECTNNVIADSGVPADSVKGLGFDATCSLAVLNKETSAPISVAGPDFTDTSHSVILWADHRARKQTDKINKTEHDLLKYVGGTMSLEMEMPKILWLKEHMPESLFKQCKFYDLPDYLTFEATGNEARSFCSIVCKMGYVPDSPEGWARDFCEKIGLKEFCDEDFASIGGINGKNGKVLSAGERVGGLTAKAAKQMGLKEGTPVGSGVIDAYAGWAGTVAAKVSLKTHLVDTKEGFVEKEPIDLASHRLAAVAGTSTCHLVISKDPIFVPGVWGPYKEALIPGAWMAEGGQSATGSLLHHILTTHGAARLAEDAAKAAGQNLFDFLNQRLETLRVEAKEPTVAHLIRHTFLYPDYHGNRSPLADADMRGVIVGLGMDADIDALATHYYAALEAIGMQTRHIIDALNEQGHQITTVFMSGGQCKNPLLMHLLASCINLPVVMPEYIDAAVVLGSAFLGVKAATGGELWGVMEKMSRSGTVVYPTEDEAEKKLLQRKYQVFRDMADVQRRYRKFVDSDSDNVELDKITV